MSFDLSKLIYTPKLNRGHPLTEGLVLDVPLNARSGLILPVDLVTGIRATSGGSGSKSAIVGRYGWSVEFNNTGQYFVWDSPLAKSYNYLTLEVIFLRQSGGNGGGYGALAGVRDSANAVDWFSLENDNSDGGWGTRLNCFYTATEKVWSIPYPSNNVWHHYIATYDHTNKDNVPEVWGNLNKISLTNRFDSGWTKTINCNRFFVANKGSGTGSSWDGYIALARMWSRRLTYREIFSLFADPYRHYQKVGVLLVKAPPAGTATNDERSATLKGQESANSERAATITGKDTANSERSAVLTGTETANSERGATILGQDSTSSERSATITGKDTANAERSAVITGAEGANSERSGVITGKDTASSERSATVTGKDTANSERSAVLTGTTGVSEDRSAVVTGKDTANAERAVTITGKDTANAERSATLLGTDSINSERNATITGKDTTSAERAAVLTGQQSANDERAGMLTGQELAVSEILGHLWGKLTAFDERGGITTGAIFASSERGAIITGKVDRSRPTVLQTAIGVTILETRNTKTIVPGRTPTIL